MFNSYYFSGYYEMKLGWFVQVNEFYGMFSAALFRKRESCFATTTTIVLPNEIADEQEIPFWKKESQPNLIVNRQRGIAEATESLILLQIS